MSDEAFNDQRPAVVVAVILAALTAAGLWYFFVFRTNELPEAVQASPTITPVAAGADLITVDRLAPQISITPISTAAIYVEPTAGTGPAATGLLTVVGLTIVGLLGLILTLRSYSIRSE